MPCACAYVCVYYIHCTVYNVHSVQYIVYYVHSTATYTILCAWIRVPWESNTSQSATSLQLGTVFNNLGTARQKTRHRIQQSRHRSSTHFHRLFNALHTIQAPCSIAYPSCSLLRPFHASISLNAASSRPFISII